MTTKLAERVAVITGGASGIGAATARLFAAEGARVALVDQDATLLQETVHGIGADRALALDADVTDAAAARAGVAHVLDAWGRIDVVMTAAGISVGGTVATIEEALWDRVFAVNVKGTYLWLRAALPHMIERGSGAIVMIASQLAVSSGGNNAAYIASKGAIVSLTRTMAVDHAPHGIRVNALMPGVIDTPMPRRSLQRYADPEATRARWMARHPLGRFGRPEEVAKAALYLASDDSAFTTGSLLFVDGGWTAM
jgi:NAD(P)-dependent dehydrogenase (short-subunit alcohol dehydrogenase family)